MNIVIDAAQYDAKNAYFCDSIRNNIINDGSFIRILYSTNFVTFNGIYLLLQLNDSVTERHFNKLKCCFNTNNHREIIQKIKEIEDSILEKIEIDDKIPQKKIFEQLISGNIKLFSDILPKSNSDFILKISGVWVTRFHYGLTYKFFPTMEIS